MGEAAGFEVVEPDVVGAAAVGGERDARPVGGDGGLPVVAFAVGESLGGGCGRGVGGRGFGFGGFVGRRRRVGARRQVERPEVPGPTAVGLEDDSSAVRVEVRPTVVAEPVGERLRFAAGRGEAPERALEVDDEGFPVRGRRDGEVGAFADADRALPGVRLRRRCRGGKWRVFRRSSPRRSGIGEEACDCAGDPECRETPRPLGPGSGASRSGAEARRRVLPGRFGSGRAHQPPRPPPHPNDASSRRVARAGCLRVRPHRGCSRGDGTARGMSGTAACPDLVSPLHSAGNGCSALGGSVSGLGPSSCAAWAA